MKLRDWFGGGDASSRGFANDWNRWAEQRKNLGGKLELADAYQGEPAPEGSGFVLNSDESCYLLLDGAALIEGKRLPGRWKGGSQGVSLRVVRGVYYRVGGTRGTYAPGDETLAGIDTGSVLVTNRRAIFAGSLQTREWDFKKLMVCKHDQRSPITFLQVSNRQKVSGFGYDSASQDQVRFRVDLALAEHAGTRETLRRQLEEQLQALKRREPTPSGAGWYPDPDGKGQRYWSGAEWTSDTAP